MKLQEIVGLLVWIRVSSTAMRPRWKDGDCLVLFVTE